MSRSRWSRTIVQRQLSYAGHVFRMDWKTRLPRMLKFNYIILNQRLILNAIHKIVFIKIKDQRYTVDGNGQHNTICTFDVVICHVHIIKLE